DHGSRDHIDVAEALDRAVIWPPGDRQADIVVYTAIAEAARVNVGVGDREWAGDKVGSEPDYETGCTHRRCGNDHRIVRETAVVERRNRCVGVTIQGKSL